MPIQLNLRIVLLATALSAWAAFANADAGASKPQAAATPAANSDVAAKAKSIASKAAVITTIPPRRSSQISDGFGINSDLPRGPYLPWDRWWWTRMFDAGVKWIRIGQYENSSDQTSWDWIERLRGRLVVPPELDDEVNSLVDNGVQVQIQLLYGNPMYTSPAGKLPETIVPEPGSFHNPDRSLFSAYWPPRTPEQLEAFTRYATFMVDHFRGRVHYWAVWNEQDIDYWNPAPDPEAYGRLLAAVVPAIHKTDPEAKVIYGGQAWPLGHNYAKRALDTCQCAAGIDVFAYHIYPDYGRNLNPEAVDDRVHAVTGGRAFREMIRRYPGVKSNVQFWCDEFNSIPTWEGMDDSAQIKYIPRQLVYNWGENVKTFVWLLTSATDGNEYDDFGMIHGRRDQPDDFTPRPVYSALANTNWLFSNSKPDPSIRIEVPEAETIRKQNNAPIFTYAFRSASGKAIVAYWLGLKSQPGKNVSATASLRVTGASFEHPVLIDITSGRVTPLAWKDSAHAALGPLPIGDSLRAVADSSYFDWQVLPEAPSGLKTAFSADGPHLSWEIHGFDSTGVVLERRIDIAPLGQPKPDGHWDMLTTLPAGTLEYVDGSLTPRSRASYRVRATNAAGASAYSNIVHQGR